MILNKSKENISEKVLNNFKNIKDSIKGIHEILNICLEKDDIYYDIGKDNIIALYKNFIELIMNEDGLKEILEKIKNSEIKFDIPLDY